LPFTLSSGMAVPPSSLSSETHDTVHGAMSAMSISAENILLFFISFICWLCRQRCAAGMFIF
ncbi:hypothetical protein VPJ68_01135, partial [Parabacteroides distasonis]